MSSCIDRKILLAIFCQIQMAIQSDGSEFLFLLLELNALYGLSYQSLHILGNMYKLEFFCSKLIFNDSIY